MLLSEYHTRYPPARDERGVPPLADASAYLAGEFTERLRQLSVLYPRIETLNEFVNAQVHPVRQRLVEKWRGREPQPFAAWYPLSQELFLWVDCFYFIAWRALQIVKNKPKVFANLGRVDAAGIRDVRNHLLQHPESRASGAVEQNWSFGGPEGPCIKPQVQLPRRTEFRDPGLFVNAAEFRTNLDAAFSKALV